MKRYVRVSYHFHCPEPSALEFFKVCHAETSLDGSQVNFFLYIYKLLAAYLFLWLLSIYGKVVLVFHL